MTGYQEILRTLLLRTIDGDYQCTYRKLRHYRMMKVNLDTPKIAGLICKNFSYNPSRQSSDQSLEDFLNEVKLFAISDVDTRALVRHIRKHGAMNAVISTDINNIKNLKEKLKDYPKMDGLELASKVSTKAPYFYGNKRCPI